MANETRDVEKLHKGPSETREVALGKQDLVGKSEEFRPNALLYLPFLSEELTNHMK